MVFSGQYLTFNEYKALNGTIAETPFNLLEFECRKKLNNYTMNRIEKYDTIPQEIKICVCQLINLTLDENYLNANQNEKTKFEYNIIDNYLGNLFLSDGTPILYRGI